MVGVHGVHEVHDLHVWEVTSGFPALSAHVLVGATTTATARREDLEAVLHDRFGIEHTTCRSITKAEISEIEVRGGV